MAEYVLVTRALTKRYGAAAAVDGVDLAVEKGQIYGLVGRNGAGKTTIIRMLTAQTVPTTGEIELFGQTTEKGLATARARTGAMVETPSFYLYLTARENLEYYRRQRGIPGAQCVDRALEQVGLHDAGKKKFKQFSLGMKQRLGLAQALLGYPKLLILDEPTNGLDPAGIQEMRELIRSLPRRFGMTVVVSSHLLSEIDQMADHVAIIREGELVFQDTLEALHAHSRHHLALRTANNGLACGLLTERAVPCHEEEGWLILPLLDDETAARLTRFLAENRLGVVRLEERQKSLEDIFLELTGKAASL